MLTCLLRREISGVLFLLGSILNIGICNKAATHVYAQGDTWFVMLPVLLQVLAKSSRRPYVKCDL